MAAKKKQGTVAKVAETVQDTAAAVARAATEKVVRPVGKALGLSTGDGKGGTRKARAERARRAAKAESAKAAPKAATRRPAKKAAAKVPSGPAPGKRTTSAKMMSRPVTSVPDSMDTRFGSQSMSKVRWIEYRVG